MEDTSGEAAPYRRAAGGPAVVVPVPQVKAGAAGDGVACLDRGVVSEQRCGAWWGEERLPFLAVLKRALIQRR